MPNGKPNILVLWGDDKRRELDATGAVDLLDRAQLDHRPRRHRQVLHTQRMHLHPPIERLPVAPRQGSNGRKATIGSRATPDMVVNDDGGAPLDPRQQNHSRRLRGSTTRLADLDRRRGWCSARAPTTPNQTRAGVSAREGGRPEC